MEANNNNDIKNSTNPLEDASKQIMQPQPPQPLLLEPYNDFDLHWNQLLAEDNSTEWYPLGTVHSPYSYMTPQLDVVWARGWYNAFKPPTTVPLEYYNRAGLEGGRTSPDLLQQYFPPTLCGPRWMRIDDLEWWMQEILPQMRCPFTLLTGDGIVDVPTMVSPYPQDIDRLINCPYLEAWYAQNTVLLHPKLIPLPLGLPIHYGFPGSPHSADTVQTMLDIRQQQQQQAPNNSFRRRSRRILLDLGTTEGGGSRAQARMQALEALQRCPERVEVKSAPTDPVTTWKHDYSTHQFAVVVRGTGWDTYRTWEFLLYGTVPIMLAGTPLDLLHQPAHTPVLQVQEWSEICQWSDEYYNALVDHYEGWIANAHRWLRPSLWAPRNQEEMEQLCDTSPGCRDPPPQRPGMRIQRKDDLDLTPGERDTLLKALLKNASPEDMERLLADEKIQEKVSDQLVLLRQHHSESQHHPDFVACSQQCEALQTESAPCVMLGEAITFACKDHVSTWTELLSIHRWF